MPDSSAHLDPAQITFANLLRDVGYATAIGGKWQLGGDYEGVGKIHDGSESTRGMLLRRLPWRGTTALDLP